LGIYRFEPVLPAPPLINGPTPGSDPGPAQCFLSAGTEMPPATSSGHRFSLRRSKPAATGDERFALGPAPGCGSSGTDVPLADLRGAPPGPADLRVRPPAGASDPVAGEPIEPDEPVGYTPDLDRMVRILGPPAGLFLDWNMVADPAHGG
jgi:hypothetical protein